MRAKHPPRVRVRPAHWGSPTGRLAWSTAGTSQRDREKRVVEAGARADFPGSGEAAEKWPRRAVLLRELAQNLPRRGGGAFGLRRCAPSRQPAQVRRPRDFGSTLYTLYIYNVTNVNGDRGQGRSPARNRQKPYKMDVNTPGPARLKVYNRDIEPANPARARLGQPAHPARAQLGRTQGGQAWLSALGGA